MNIVLKKVIESSYSDSEVCDYHSFDIYADGQKVGSIEIIDCFNEENDICYVERIDIDEEYRGQGIGTEVLKNTLYSDFGYYTTIVAPDNEDAQRLYERIGREYNCTNEGYDFSYNDQGYGVYEI